jgi:hypothetical protein
MFCPVPLTGSQPCCGLQVTLKSNDGERVVVKREVISKYSKMLADAWKGKDIP